MEQTAADREELRAGLVDLLKEHSLTLEVLTWKEDLVQNSLTLTLKVSGELAQTELPFVLGE
jgi:hypothetical protein